MRAIARGHRAGGGGGADAHFPGNDNLYTLVSRFGGSGYARLHGGAAFLRGHGRPGGDIPSAPADRPAQDAGLLVIGGDPHVHHLDLSAAAPGKGVNGASAPGEIHRLIRRDIYGGRRHPLGGYAVVRTEHHRPLSQGLRARRALYAGQPDHHGFQRTQASR